MFYDNPNTFFLGIHNILSKDIICIKNNKEIQDINEENDIRKKHFEKMKKNL